MMVSPFKSTILVEVYFESKFLTSISIICPFFIAIDFAIEKLLSTVYILALMTIRSTSFFPKL